MEVRGGGEGRREATHLNSKAVHMKKQHRMQDTKRLNKVKGYESTCKGTQSG